EYFGRPMMSANTGYFGVGFANAGYLGLAIYTFIMGVFMAFVRWVERKQGAPFAASALAVTFLGMIMIADPSVALFTHGGAVACLLVAVIVPKSGRLVDNASTRRR